MINEEFDLESYDNEDGFKIALDVNCMMSSLLSV